MHSVRLLLPRFCAKNNFVTFQKANVAKIMVNVRKSLKSVSFKADFLYDDNIDHSEKKALNSDFEQGRLHGEIGLQR